MKAWYGWYGGIHTMGRYYVLRIYFISWLSRTLNCWKQWPKIRKICHHFHALYSLRNYTHIHKHTVHTLHCTVSSLPIHFTSDMYQQDQSSSPKYERRTQIFYHIIFEVRALQHYACCYTIISQPCTWETAWADLGGIHTHVCAAACVWWLQKVERSIQALIWMSARMTERCCQLIA